LALLRECEGLSRRHEDGTDTGDFPTIDFADVFHLLPLECPEGQGLAGNIAIDVVIYGRIRMWYLCFNYTPVSTFSLILDEQS